MSGSTSADRLARLLRLTLVAAILALALPAMASAVTIKVDGDDQTPDGTDNNNVVDCGTGTSNECDTIQRGVDEAGDITDDVRKRHVRVDPADERTRPTPSPRPSRRPDSRCSVPSTRPRALVSGRRTFPPRLRGHRGSRPAGLAAFTINGSGIRVAGFAIQGVTGNDIAGIDIVGSGALVNNNVIRENSFGARPTGSRPEIDSNAFYDNNETGTNTGNGIFTNTAVPGVAPFERPVGVNNTFADHDTAAVRPLRRRGMTTTRDDRSQPVEQRRHVPERKRAHDSTVSGNVVNGSDDHAMAVGGSEIAWESRATCSSAAAAPRSGSWALGRATTRTTM